VTDPSQGDTDATAATTAAIPKQGASLGRASALLASGTLVSRVLGFANGALLTYAISAKGNGTDAFALANQLPNNVYSLVAGGLLSAVIVPQIVKAAVHADGGQAYINKLLTLGLSVFLPLSALAVLAAPLLAAAYAGTAAPEVLSLTTAFAFWCLPQIFFYALYSLLGETLNARGVFGPFTWTPALNNIVAIAGLVVFIALFGREGHDVAANWTAAEIAVLGGSTTLGIVVQAVGLLFFWRRTGLRFRPDFGWRNAGLSGAGRSAAWVFGMFLVSQASGLVESRVAIEVTGDNASVAALKYAWLMFMLPHSVVTVSIITAYFTRMSGHVRDGDLASVRTDLVASLRTILLFMVFAAVGLAVLAYPFAAVFSGPQVIAPVYLGYLLGLVPWTIFFVLLRVYYALDDTRTAFLIQVVQTVVYCAGALTIGATVAEDWLAVGLAVWTSVSLTVQAALSALVLRRRLGGLGTVEVARHALWYLGAAIPAAAAGIGVLALLGGVGPGAFPVSSIGAGILTMVVAGSVMAAVYVLVLWVTRNPELRAAAAPVLRRLRRG
jgi:putative peptidoglycan lipid II flippase